MEWFLQTGRGLGIGGLRLFLCSLLMVFLVAGRGWAEAPARIVGISLEPETRHLVLDVADGVFDPVFWVEKAGSRYRILIEAENVRLDSALARDALSLNEAMAKAMPQLHSVNLFQHTQNGLPTVKLVLEVSERLQPQIRANTGARITISLAGGKEAQAGDASEPEASSYMARSLGVVTLDDPAKAPQKATKPAQASPKPVSAQDAKPFMPSLAVSSTSSSFSTPPSGREFSIYAMDSSLQADPAVRQAWKEYREGRLESARMTLESYLGKQPEDTVARYLLALTHLAEDEKQRATMALQKLVALDTQFLPGWVELINLNLVEGNFSETDELLNQALGYLPDHPELLYAQGLLQEAKGEVDAARQTYLKVLSAQPDHLVAHYRLAITELKSNRPRAAEVALKRILLKNPDDIAAMKALGYAYHRDNNVENARETYRRALKPDVLINYAGLLQQQKQDEEALALYRAAEIIAGEDAAIHYNLGMIYAEMNRREEAIRSLNRFMALTQAQSGATTATTQERLDRAKAKLEGLGAKVAAPAWLKGGEKAGRKSVDYEFGVSATEEK